MFIYYILSDKETHIHVSMKPYNFDRVDFKRGFSI